MTTLDKIKAEIQERIDMWGEKNDEYHDCLEIIDKYAEQEPSDNHEEKPHSLLDAYFQMREQVPCDRIEYGTDGNAYKLWMSNGKEFEQEQCTDAVSRQAVLDINESHHGQMPNHINHQIWQEIKALPSVRPQEPCEDAVSRQAERGET